MVFFFIEKQYISANKLRTFRLFNNLYINLKCLTSMLVILKLGWKSINACINLVLNSYINKFSYFVLVFFVRDQRVGTVWPWCFQCSKDPVPSVSRVAKTSDTHSLCPEPMPFTVNLHFRAELLSHPTMNIGLEETIN